MAPRKTSALSACLLCFISSGPFFVKGNDKCRSKPGLEVCSSTDNMFCHTGQHPQIVDAYFVNETDHKVCGINCKAQQTADGDFKCLANIKQTGSSCVQRLSYADVDIVYKTCVRPLSRNCTFGDFSNLLSLRSTFKVHYYCIQENSTIDPCLAFEEQRSHASLWLPYNTTSCHSVCEITPNVTKRLVYFKYQLIETLTRSHEPMGRENNITFKVTFTPSTGNMSEWKQFDSSYYDDYKLLHDVEKLQIRFIIPRGDVVGHLWIAINGDQNPILVITIVAAVLGVAVLVLVAATIFIIRKRRGRQRRKRNAGTKGDNNERQPDNQTNASLPSPNYGDYIECFIPGDSNPDPAPPRDPEAEAVVTAHPGCDVGDEYGHLQRDGRVGMAGGPEESENYDHMPVGTRPRSDVYNVLQRDQKKQEVVDNVYNMTS